MKYFNHKKNSFAREMWGRMAFLPFLLMLLSLASCDKELDVKTDFPFELQVMPVPKSIAKGEKVTIRCTLKTPADYQGTKYYIRYFQFDGKGKLLLGGNQALKPNDLYGLTEQQFRLYYFSESTVTQSFDIWVSNSHGHEQKMSFQFNATDE